MFASDIKQFNMNSLKKYALLICITFVCINSNAQWSGWKIYYENGIPVSATPEEFLDGRPTPFFRHRIIDNNSLVIKGRILHKTSFIQFKEVLQDPDLYFMELEVLDDFGKELPKTIVLVPDTCGGSFHKDFGMDIRIDYMVNHANENEKTGYFFFYQNKKGQLCYSEVLCIRGTRVEEYLTRWDGLLRSIKKEGMPVPRFERKLKRKLKK